MKKLFLAITLLTNIAAVHAGPSCMGYTQNDPETGVGTDGNLRYVCCDCECRKFERTSDNRCLNCLHHQAGTALGFMVETSDHNDLVVNEESH